ncbi:MAG TPA: thioredoxin domain-containing protein, partial [Anaeromyxobacteraceae bacterium]|nr:thioredoxin domain-containing protein [Anaeromyxobacteraceae bacterium]
MTTPLPRRRHARLALLAAAALALAACGADSTPTPAVMKVPVGTSPVAGPADAWVTVVEFSDFQCGFCAQAHATLDAVLPEFGADVRLVYKHYPLSFHVHARATAEASVCAHAQGRFCEFHDIVFAEQASLMSA